MPPPPRPDAVARPAPRPGCRSARGDANAVDAYVHTSATSSVRPKLIEDRPRRIIVWQMPDGIARPRPPLPSLTLIRRQPDGSDCPEPPRAVGGGTTLVILLVLAAALYVAVAGSLASSATAQLDSRFDQVESDLTGNRPGPPDDGPYGFLFGGGGGGTIALAVDQQDTVLTQRGFHLPDGLPNMDARAARGMGVGCPDGITSRRSTGRVAGAHQTPVASSRRTCRPTTARHMPSRSSVTGRRAADTRHVLVVLLVGGWSSSSWHSGSGRSMRDGRVDPRVAQPARRVAANASSRPTPATSCGHR